MCYRRGSKFALRSIKMGKNAVLKANLVRVLRWTKAVPGNSSSLEDLMNNRIKTECARINCLRMLILIIASVSFLSFSEARLFLWSSVFWVKGEKKKKGKQRWPRHPDFYSSSYSLPQSGHEWRVWHSERRAENVSIKCNWNEGVVIFPFFTNISSAIKEMLTKREYFHKQSRTPSLRLLSSSSSSSPSSASLLWFS